MCGLYEKDSMTKHKTNNGYGDLKHNPHALPFTSAYDNKSSKDKVLEVLNRYGKKVEVLNRYGKKVEDVTRKAEALAGGLKGLKGHLKFGPSISDAAKARFAQGTKMFVEGGPERGFQRQFDLLAKEKLLDFFVCYISTTSGPITGMLYISNQRITFCSDFAIRSENNVPAYYKVVMELEKIRNIGSSSNKLKPCEKYVNVVTQDGLEFWFMGFVSYMDAYNCLNKALHNINYDSGM